MEKLKNFLFRNGGVRQTVVKNTFWVAFGTTITKIIRVGIIIYIARLLGTEDYGIFTYAISLIGIFTLFSDIGLTSILTRELGKRTEEKLEYLSTALIIKLLFLSVTIILVASFAPLLSKFEEAKPILIILAFSILIESLRNFFYAITRANNQMEKEAGLNIGTELLTTAAIVFFFFKSPTVEILSWAYLIGNILGLGITIFFLRKNLVGIFTNFKKHLVKPIIQSAWPFALMGIFGIFMTNIDSVLIGIFTDPHTLGLYAAAQKPISFLYILPGFLGISIFAIINKFSREKKEDKISLTVEKSCIASVAMALPIIFGGILLARPIINVMFGYDFIEAALTFQILLVSLFFAFPGAILGDLLLAKDERMALIASSFWAAIVNVGLDLILIPPYGIIGSAISTVCAQLVAALVFYLYAKKYLGLQSLGGFRKIFISTILMSVLTYSLLTISLPLIWIIIISAIFYLALLWVMGEQTIEEIKKSFRTSL